MTSPSNSAVQNLLPVQAYFDTDDNFVTFIGQGKPFTATISPDQSGLNITNSTINSTTIGATTPSTGVFTNIATTTGTITTAASGPTDIVNKQYVDYFAAGLSWKAPAITATSANITLSGLQTINSVTVVAGDTVLVKNQTNAAENGIYIASAGAWTYSQGGNVWSEYVGAIIFISSGSLNGTAWYCTAQPGGTLGVTAMNWSNFSVASTYTAGTGLSLIGTQFSITNTGATAATYGSASRSITQTVNAQGQITNIFDQPIDITISQINNLGTGVGTALAVNTGAAGAFVVNGGALGTPASGNFSTGTFTWPTFNQNTTGYAASLAGGAAGSVPYQTAANTTTFLAAGTNGQILTLAAGVPTWANAPATGVTSVGTAGTVSGITLTGGPITSTGTITLGGTLDLSSPPAIGGTTANTIRGTVITATTNFVGPYLDAATSAGGALRNASGVAQVQWGAGGGSNFAIDVAANINPANAQVDLSPTGTGTVRINPATASTMNNVAIGGTTPLAGTFTDLRFNGTLSLAGSTGTSNYLLQSNGASAPSWVNPASLTVSAASTATTATNATNVAITDDTTTASAVYPSWVTTTTGNLPIKTASTKLSFVPSTGVLSATGFAGAGTGLTGTATSLSIGGNAANVTGTVAIANGGTGQTTAAAAFNALDPMTTTGDMIYASAANTAARLPVGSTGQVLTVAGGVPTWAAAGGGGASGVSGQAFTSNGTFTIPTGVTALKVTVVGGGGGTGSGQGSACCGSGSSGGGGGGGAAIKYLTGLTAGNTLAVTIGGGGGVTATGGTSSVASGTQSITTISASGGSGTPNQNANTGNGGIGGIGSNGDINIRGGTGSPGGAYGGTSIMGGSAAYTFSGNTRPSAAGLLYGGGGSGTSSNGNAISGASGAAGIVMFEW
jgi:hypothetical protein